LHALDAVRGFALIVGIFFHATISFLPVYSFLPWPVMDSQRSVAMAAVFYFAHIFRMTLFFFVCGFFARMSFHKKGARGFVTDRVIRIALPLVIALPVVDWLIRHLALWGIALTAGESFTLPDRHWSVSNFPLAHLWFLYILLLIYAAWLPARVMYGVVVARVPALDRLVNRSVAFVVSNPLGLLLVCAPAAFALYTAERWRMWFGIQTPDRSLIPILSSTVCFFVAFGFGWLVQRQKDLLRRWAQRWAFYLAVAFVATAAAVSMVGLMPATLPVVEPTTKLLYAGWYALAGWAWSMALIGLAVRFLSNHSPARRYVADASYWLYLAHLPLVIALQIGVAPLHWPPWAKYAMVLAIAFPVLFVSYHYLVRFTPIGTVLNGRRLRRAPELHP
jgi:glucan biosynthesis protein C